MKSIAVLIFLIMAASAPVFGQELIIVDCASPGQASRKSDGIVVYNISDKVPADAALHRDTSVIIIDAPAHFLPGTVGPAIKRAVPPDEIKLMVNEISLEFGIDPSLILAVIQVESNYNVAAVSPVGAMGLMQLMPDTAAALGVKDPWNPRENIWGGVRYLRAQIDRFSSIELALAAYNAGPGAVEKHGGIPPYDETIMYVEAVMSIYLGTRP